MDFLQNIAVCFDQLLRKPERVLKIIKILFKHKQPRSNSWKELKLLGITVYFWGSVGWIVTIRNLTGLASYKRAGKSDLLIFTK